MGSHSTIIPVLADGCYVTKSYEKIKCKECGWLSTDIVNQAGGARFHLIEKHDIPATKLDWQQHYDFMTIEQKRLVCPYCNDWSTCDINNVAGYITNHIKIKHGKTREDLWEDYPEYRGYWFHRWPKKVNQDLIQTSNDHHIECLECGDKLGKISWTHLKFHNMTCDEYKRKHNLDNLSSNATKKKLSVLYFKNEKLLQTNYISHGQTEIFDFLKSIDPSTREHRRVDHIELDIFIPSKNIAVEYNGLYWHSESYSGKDKNYHIGKTEYAEKNGIRLIHIFEDEWRDKQDIVKSRLSGMLGVVTTKVYARNCTVKFIDSKVANQFLIENHIQGRSTAFIHIGLYYNDELVSVMSFGKRRVALGAKTVIDDSYELYRFCVKKYMNCVGGASKILKYFENTYKPVELISYADRRYTTTMGESVYDKLGMTRIGISKPNYWYMKRYLNREHRFTYTKQRILKLFPDSDPSKTEWDLMQLNGYDRIWDCGSIKYQKIY